MRTATNLLEKLGIAATVLLIALFAADAMKAPAPVTAAVAAAELRQAQLNLLSYAATHNATFAGVTPNDLVPASRAGLSVEVTGALSATLRTRTTDGQTCTITTDGPSGQVSCE